MQAGGVAVLRAALGVGTAVGNRQPRRGTGLDALGGSAQTPAPLQRLLSLVSIAAIALGLAGAASDSEHWSAGMTAAALGALAMVAWAIVRSLSRAIGY